jgi:hypothetical protein
MAVRSAISLARAAARRSSRLATFAPAMTSTNITTAMTIRNNCRPLPPMAASGNVSTRAPTIS